MQSLSNPDGDVQPWCYVAETEEGIYWRYCDIPTCHMPGYLGCFVDSGAPPALSGPSGTSTKLTVQVCLRFCRMKGYQPLSGGVTQSVLPVGGRGGRLRLFLWL